MVRNIIAIVGGGLAGSLLANGLLNNGVEVSLYERDAANSKREGYQIRIGEAADIGFDACLTDKVKSAIRAKCGQSSAMGATAPTICNSKFQTLLDLTQLPSYSKSAAINRVVLRNILLEPVQAAGRVQCEKRLERYDIVTDRQGRERVELLFSDGSTDQCDILVGADGSRSTINRQVGARNLVDIDSHVMFLNKGDLSEGLINKMPSRLRAGPIATFTKDMSFFFALYLPASGVQSIKKSTGEDYDLGQGSFYWGLTIKRERVPHGDATKLHDMLAFCLEQTRDWDPAYRTMISAGADTGQTAHIISAPLRSSKRPSQNWRETLRKREGADVNEGHPRVWLIGDAIHAMQPNRGMGGNQAMLDCADLLPELLKLNTIAKSGAVIQLQDVTLAVTRYENKMIPRAFGWVKKSGGTSVPSINLDGFLGTVLKAVGSLLSVVFFCYSKLYSPKKDKQS
ncbi:hypothetical protein F5X68DRAFT_223060 [Plectosphaerella plurivora]|uniref:FAD-binding domain-containing protein n=1 Tax=Plectosphaerella plurivora TaxID=936078 RepID=A0A9P8V6W5_9PEZI|nr:hypothetical protein F5X68DRAFT_223060 [Plectosphaerella plurivora]